MLHGRAARHQTFLCDCLRFAVRLSSARCKAMSAKLQVGRSWSPNEIKREVRAILVLRPRPVACLSAKLVRPSIQQTARRRVRSTGSVCKAGLLFRGERTTHPWWKTPASRAHLSRNLQICQAFNLRVDGHLQFPSQGLALTPWQQGIRGGKKIGWSHG